MTINKDTKLFISASQRPGGFGATVFNKLFAMNGINAVYLPRKFESAGELLKAIKSMDIAGCAVSTPLKKSVLAFLDDLDPIAKKLNSVNTIKAEDGLLTGHNTDWIGAETALRNKFGLLGWAPKSARILGSGGVVPSIVHALNNLGIFDVTVAARNPAAAADLKKNWNVAVENLQEPDSVRKDILVNAIPVSEPNNEQMVGNLLEHSDLLFDLSVSPHPSAVIQNAVKNKKETVQGFEMAAYQLMEQYFLYFGARPSVEEIFQIIRQDYLTAN